MTMKNDFSFMKCLKLCKIDFSKEDERRDKEIAKIHKMYVRIIKRRFKKKLIK